ncbi:unnamed protein product [Thelazia callipaeda]|uniref:Uncharacterized protein n=1 Tax=Thelazia callipaeda TaxID=103827 RepID=A0A0N5CSZ5_THECL|nr:unnamed protein product [Thelazia callipaeda]
MKVAVENESYNANTRGNGQIRSGKTSLSKTKQIAKSFDATTTTTSYPSTLLNTQALNVCM